MMALQDAGIDDFSAELISLALARGASAAQARTSAGRHFEMQFDNRGVDLVRSTENEVSSITVFIDGKRGAATLNGRSPDEIDAAIDAALAAADAGVPDEANDVAEAESLPVGRHGPESADLEKMAAGIEAFLARIRAEFPLVRTRDCLHAFSEWDAAFANSRGVRQRERRASYDFSAGFMAKDGPRTTSVNWAGASSYAPFEDPFRAGGMERLIVETARSLDRKPVPEKFEGDVIITPECLSGLIWSIVSALSGAALFSGTSPFKDKTGETIASPLFSLSNVPCDAASPGGADFDGYGVPTRNLDVVENGVLNAFLIDFFFSRKLGLPQTAGAHKFFVAPGTTPLAEVIAKTRRGIVFSRFSGGAPNSNLDFTGIAKNSFYVEGGEIRHAVEETMVSGNFQELLKNIHAVSSEYVDFGSACYPFLAASGVTISSK
jgi:PmbA protein